MEIRNGDLQWLAQHHPELTLTNDLDSWRISGEYRFVATWDESRRVYLVNPSESESSDLIVISDSYEIQIEAGGNSNPKLNETGQRILTEAKNLGVEPRDLHIYESGETCLMGVFDTRDFVSLSEFMDGPVLQFFYDQSYHQRYGRWPRGQYQHGLFGVIESFNDQSQERRTRLLNECLGMIFNENRKTEEAEFLRMVISSRKRLQGHWPCPCGSGKEFRACHVGLFHGLWFLQKNYDGKKT